jgi:hypothetical protein
MQDIYMPDRGYTIVIGQDLNKKAVEQVSVIAGRPLFIDVYDKNAVLWQTITPS